MNRAKGTRRLVCQLAPLFGLAGSAALGQTGPDVIVGDLPDISNYASQDVSGVTMRAFAVGTTSCNIGNTPLNWQANVNQHPVIGQNLFRLANNRFEHIGQAWLKHGFTALQGNVCSTCSPNPNGTRLGVGCSDPYSSSLNGGQSGLGPKWEVNAATGFYPYPYTDSSGSGSVFKRLQVRQSDLDIAGAVYFAEGQYVTPDDAAAGNQNNNASYRRVFISGSYQMSVQAAFPTQRTKPGIQAWADSDPEVRLVVVDVPGDGRFFVASKAIANANDWTYEYAVQNLNSDRAAGQFSVELLSGAAAVNGSIGFHDVDYHSGEIQGGADWASSTTGSAVEWHTAAYSETGNGAVNALRWGTLYNFRFNSSTAPGQGLGTLGLFKPGTPESVSVSVIVPGGAPIAPIHDNCGQAVTVTGGSRAFDSTNATDSGPDEPAACNFSGFTGVSKDLWFRYVAPCDGTATVDTCGSTFDTKVAVYSGACPATAAAIACNDDSGVCGSGSLDSSLSFAATTGNVYYLRVGGYNGAAGTGTLNVTDPTCIPPPGPPNDQCANAIQVFDGVAVTGTNVGATTDGSASCAANGLDVWYRYTPATTAQVTVHTCGSSFDTVLAIYTGACGALNQVGCNDDNRSFGTTCAFTLQSRIRMTLTAGVPYLIRVSGFDDAGNVATGNITLLVTGGGGTAPPPANDNCANASTIGNGSFAYSTTGATTDGPAESACNFFNNNQVTRDTWYRYTAACDGQVTVSVCNSNFDTKLAAYGGTCPTAESAIVCNDDACGTGNALQSSVSFASVQGQQYLFRVGGFNNASGSGTLVVTGPNCPPPGPANDNCNNRAGVGDGLIPFDTTFATTDGPAHAGCGQFANDIWFNYPAQVTGTLTIATCTSAYDSKVAVYAGDNCADLDSRLIACSDNDCDDDATLTIPIVDGTSYTIRIGGAVAGGAGHLSLSSQATPTGACCDAGSCSNLTEAECAASGGVYQGNGTDCGEADCAPPTGACCLADGSCSQTTAAMCESAAGTYQGDGTDCGAANCPQPTGACCLADGSCITDTAAGCATAGGAYQGDGTDCGASNCPRPTGACCLADGSCSSGTDEDCHSHGGAYQGDGTDCGSANCPQPTGACCLSDGTCSAGTEADCASHGGAYQGNGTDCGAANCPQPTGACCIDRCTCVLVTEADCAAQGGVYGGTGSECAGGASCYASPRCPCDWNGADGLDSQDFFDFLEGFFGGNADYNCADGTDSQDYFDFIECFFGALDGCQ